MTQRFNDSTFVKVKDIFGRHCKIEEESLLFSAKSCIDEKFVDGETLSSSAKTRDYLKLLIGEYEREVFYVIWLNNQHRVIKHGILFQGTIDGSVVHPREVVKDGLSCNAAAVIFAHNHPSGMSEPSQADISITNKLKKVLDLIDVRTLDHFVVGNSVCSLAERGLV